MLLGTECPTGGEGVPPPAGLPPIVGGTRRAFLVVLPPYTLAGPLGPFTFCGIGCLGQEAITVWPASARPRLSRDSATGAQIAASAGTSPPGRVARARRRMQSRP